jgi:hypothetical protein
LKGYPNPTQGSDEEWDLYGEFIESDSEFRKSQMQYVEFCQILEEASKDSRRLSKLIFATKFVALSIRARNFSNGIRKGSMDRIAANWIAKS